MCLKHVVTAHHAVSKKALPQNWKVQYTIHKQLRYISYNKTNQMQ